MRALSVLSHVAAATLLVGGVAKLRDPGSVRPLLAVVGERLRLEVPSLYRRLLSPQAGRLVGAIEVLIGFACLAGNRIAAFVVAVAYALFAQLLMTARAEGVESCGCFGTSTTPPTVGHVLANLAAAIVVFWGALGAPSSPVWAPPSGGWPLRLAYLLSVGAATALTVALGTVAGEVTRARRLLAEEPPAPRPAGLAS